MPLTDSDKQNFETLKRAFSKGNVALVEGTEAATGEYVALLCVIQKVGVEVEVVPFARLSKGNPYEEWSPPTSDSSGR